MISGSEPDVISKPTKGEENTAASLSKTHTDRLVHLIFGHLVFGVEKEEKEDFTAPDSSCHTPSRSEVEGGEAFRRCLTRMMYFALFCPAWLKKTAREASGPLLPLDFQKRLIVTHTVAGNDEPETAISRVMYRGQSTAVIANEDRFSSSNGGSLEETSEREEPGHANTQEG